MKECPLRLMAKLNLEVMICIGKTKRSQLYIQLKVSWSFTYIICFSYIYCFTYIFCFTYSEIVAGFLVRSLNGDLNVMSIREAEEPKKRDDAAPKFKYVLHSV